MTHHPTKNNDSSLLLSIDLYQEPIGPNGVDPRFERHIRYLKVSYEEQLLFSFLYHWSLLVRTGSIFRMES